MIIEDDKEIASIVATNIEDLGLSTEHITDGKLGLKRALENRLLMN